VRGKCFFLPYSLSVHIQSANLLIHGFTYLCCLIGAVKKRRKTDIAPEMAAGRACDAPLSNAHGKSSDEASGKIVPAAPVAAVAVAVASVAPVTVAPSSSLAMLGGYSSEED
jgi:hypothetical protein